NIDEAYQALQELSQDPKAQQLAEWVEERRLLHDMELRWAQRRSEAKGHREGLEEGHLEANKRALEISKRAVRDMCELLQLDMNEARGKYIESSSLEQLDQLRDELKRARRWPDDNAFPS
ncbi:MAG: hypothetical protein AAF449_01630, partial [Myxococcota bacterium]